MKKSIFLAILAGGLLLAGCAVREVPLPEEPGKAPEAVENAPTSTPEPSPQPYAELVDSTVREAEHCEKAEDVFAYYAAITPGEKTEKPSVSAVRDLSALTAGGDYCTVDGDILFVLRGSQLFLYRLAGAESSLLTTYTVGQSWKSDENAAEEVVSGSERTPLYVFAENERLAVVSDYYGYSVQDGETEYTEYTAVELWNICDPEEPIGMVSFAQSGLPAGGWLRDGVLTVLSDFTAVEASAEDTEAYIPALTEGEEKRLLHPEELYPIPGGDFPGAAVAVGYALPEGKRIGAAALAGVRAETFAMDGDLYFTAPSRTEAPALSLSDREETASIACTELYRLSMTESGASLTVRTVRGSFDASALFPAGTVPGAAAAISEYRYNAENGEETLTDTHETTGAILLGDTPEFIPAPSGEDIGAAGWVNGALRLVDAAGGKGWSVSDGSYTEWGGSAAADVFLSGGDSYVSFLKTDAGVSLALRNENGMTDELFFGADHRMTAKNTGAMLFDAETGLLCFAADDSCCLYRPDGNGKLVHAADIFLRGKASDARAFIKDGTVYVFDKRALCAVDAESLEILAEIVF